MDKPYKNGVVENDSEINLNGQADGIYFIRIEDNGSVHMVRILLSNP